mgnify:CR=1 FL=1
MILCLCIGMAPGLPSGLSTPYYKIYEKKRKKSVPEEKQNPLNSFDVCVSATAAVNFATQSDGTVASMETYTVFYDANGGTGAPPAQTKTQGVPLVLSDVQPTRTGYTFLGWSRNSNALYADYGPGDSYFIDLSATLYAVWGKHEYTIRYDANGGSGAPPAQTKTQGVPLVLSDVQPTRTGYTFLGWSRNSNALHADYGPGDRYMIDLSATLYAVWQKNPEIYTVSYHANGGSGAPKTQTKTEGSTLYLSDVVPTKGRNVFLGWSESSFAKNVDYAPGDAYTANRSVTLYAVWQYAPESYLIRYHANGGTGAPPAQTKTEGIALMLSEVIPVRERYTFLGWSLNPYDSVPDYEPGGSWTADTSVTLYAVWEKDNYDFSISELTIPEKEIYRYGTATVRFRTDNWDPLHAYPDIPVELYYDGELLGTQYVDFDVYGAAYVMFTVNVGGTAGSHTLEVRINWQNRDEEINSADNCVTSSLTVKDYAYELSVQSVLPKEDYCAGITVVTSFTVANDSDDDITPDLNCQAVFTAYYLDENLQRVLISAQTWKQVVIPRGGSNLVYFKWTVPENLAGKDVCVECTVNPNGGIPEANRTNNTAAFSKTVVSFGASQTPDTQYEKSVPSGFVEGRPPAENNQSAVWTMWEYENGEFILKKYGLTFSDTKPEVAPHSNCLTAVYEDGAWTMKSGYGISVNWTPSVSNIPGCYFPEGKACTEVQTAFALFPEYGYSGSEGEYRTLENENGAFQFVRNPDAGHERVHFVPVWYDDGRYLVSVTASQLWTPAGMISLTCHADAINIRGSLFDDYYIGG